MENVNKDEKTKQVLNNSLLEITNPEFAAIILNRIQARKRRVIVINYILSSGLFIIIVLLLIAFAIPASLPATRTIVIDPGLIEVNIVNSGIDISKWVTNNLFLLGSVAVLFILKKMADVKFLRRNTSDLV